MTNQNAPVLMSEKQILDKVRLGYPDMYESLNYHFMNKNYILQILMVLVSRDENKTIVVNNDEYSKIVQTKAMLDFIGDKNGITLKIIESSIIQK